MENLTVESFKEKVFNYEKNKEWKFNGNKPAIIDFYANWCAPCKTIAPILEELDNEYDNVDFYKVDTENQPELAQIFQIRSIPSILFIPIGEKPQMAQGALPKDTFINIIKDIFKLEYKLDSKKE